MKWTNLLLDSTSLKNFFCHEPLLEGITLFEINLRRDEPNCEMRFTLPEFPSNPPKKWQTSGFNRIQVTLQLISVARIELTGWSVDNVGNMTIEKNDELITIEFRRIDSVFICESEFINLSKISGYQQEVK